MASGRFLPGQSGNPGGRPKKGDSFAEFVRHRFTKDKRQQAVEKVMAIACEPHDDHKARIMAFTALHKAGWPHEQKADVNVNLPAVPLFALDIRPDVSKERLHAPVEVAVSETGRGDGRLH